MDPSAECGRHCPEPDSFLKQKKKVMFKFLDRAGGGPLGLLPRKLLTLTILRKMSKVEHCLLIKKSGRPDK